MSSKRKQHKDEGTKSSKLRKTEEAPTAKAERSATDLKSYADRVRHHISINGELPSGQKFKTLNNIQPNTLLEAHSYKVMSTQIGQAYILEVTQTEEVGGKSERKDFKLMIASRFEDDVISKLPCLLYYRGKQPMANGKQFHDLQAFAINDETVFQNNDETTKTHETSKPPVKARKRTAVVVENDVLDESMQELYEQAIPCEACIISGATSCFGYCACGRHQPPDGSQCPC